MAKKKMKKKAKKKAKKISKERLGPMVYGNGITHLMRVCYDNKDFEAVCGFIPSMACKHVIAICTRKADITGNDQEGFKVEYKDGEKPVEL